MGIYIIVFLVEMFLGILILGKQPQKASSSKKIIYLVITTVILGTLGGLRSSQVGYDTGNYYVSFTRTSDSFRGIFDNDQHIETGFAALCTVVKILGGNYTHFLLLCTSFIVGAFSVFVYRHSNNILFSVFILLCFPYYYSSFDIIRHFMATSFLLLGYKYILNGKFFQFAIFIAIGSVFHNSVVVYIVLYPLLRAKWSKQFFISTIIGTIIVMLFASSLANYIVAETGRFGTIAEEWVGQFAGGQLTALMYFLILIIACFARNNRLTKPKELDSSIICVLFLFAFSLLYIEARIAVRYIMTFSGIMAVAMPALLDKDKSKDKNLNKMLVFVFIIIGLSYHAYMLLSNWQNVVPYVPVMLYPYY